MAVPFNGIARKLVLPFIALTGIGWLLVVIGFGIATISDDDRDDFGDNFMRLNRPISYPYWAVALSGPFTLIAAVAHAALWKPWSHFAGAVATFLNVVFLTALGMILFFNGELIRQVDEFNEGRPEGSELNIPEYFKLEFAGAILATLFWTPVIILWNFYDGSWDDHDSGVKA